MTKIRTIALQHTTPAVVTVTNGVAITFSTLGAKQQRAGAPLKLLIPHGALLQFLHAVARYYESEEVRAANASIAAERALKAATASPPERTSP